MSFPGGKDHKESTVWQTWVWSLGWEDALEKRMSTHSSIRAWTTPMDKGTWWTTVHGVAESDTTEQLSTHTFQNDRYDKSSYHLSPYKDIISLLTVSPMLYIPYSWFIYFVTGSLYLLVSLNYFSHLPTPLLWYPPLYLWLCLHFVVVVAFVF